MTYMRKGFGLSPLQINIHSWDLLRIYIHRKGRPKIDSWNIYNAPIGSRNAGEGLHLIFTLPESPDIAGDFNIQRSAYDSKTTNDTATGETLLA